MCSIGLMTSDACKGQQDVIETLSNEEKIAISLHCNIELSNLTTLCEKHATNYLKMYPIWQKACCDPFKKHTKKITKNLRVVTINESQDMMRSSLNIAPGKKLCEPCKQKIAKKADLKEEKQSQGEQDEDFLISSFKSKRQEINEELENFNISPLKSHSKSSKHILSEGK
ncbi:ARL14 effector protein-like [Hydra vulgaris]|uniref:ARL14 effector protein-like n=1 Tax=Hydra vulgaris TaxID=6087 RepID=A0ABM4D0V6_HYDVU